MKKKKKGNNKQKKTKEERREKKKEEERKKIISAIIGENITRWTMEWEVPAEEISYTTLHVVHHKYDAVFLPTDTPDYQQCPLKYATAGLPDSSFCVFVVVCVPNCANGC